MPPSAYSALVISIIASALGALVMCVLVWRYGFTSASDAKSPERDHHIALTRFGHAAAGACFAVTAVMAAVVMATARPPAPAAPPATPVAAVVAQPDARLAERLVSLASTVQALLGRVESTDERTKLTDERVRSMESGMKRLVDDVGQANARTKQMERQLATQPPAMSVPAPAPRPAAVTPCAVAPRPSASPRMEPARRPATEPERERWVAPAPEAPAPVTPDTLPTSPPITRVVPPPAPAPPPSAAAVRSAPEPSAAQSRAAAKSPETNLTDKVKSDWQTIRRGLSSAGDDFMSAMRDVGRRIRGGE